MTETDTRSPAITDKGAAVPVYDRGWTPFWTLRNNIDDLFDDFLQAGGWSPLRRSGAAPAIRLPTAVPTLDVIDKENEVKLIADLPGMTEEEIDVQVTDSTLTISGEKKEETEEDDKDGKRYVSERRFGSFSRRIPLPDGIDQDQIAASFKNGVLTVHLPKLPEAQHPARKIKVRAAV
ncbi:Hsp20/alpha crystallin family protein [Yoonia sp.]|uniref:Hsp20/alpha crystallin family protein n=1 Tax=Yoonia sp. TaxID=2212373 RepID=UPI003F6C80EA